MNLMNLLWCFFQKHSEIAFQSFPLHFKEMFHYKKEENELFQKDKEINLIEANEENINKNEKITKSEEKEEEEDFLRQRKLFYENKNKEINLGLIILFKNIKNK